MSGYKEPFLPVVLALPIGIWSVRVLPDRPDMGVVTLTFNSESRLEFPLPIEHARDLMNYLALALESAPKIDTLNAFEIILRAKPLGVALMPADG